MRHRGPAPHVAIGDLAGTLARYFLQGWIQSRAGVFPIGTLVINIALPDLDPMIGGGLITLERARVIMYRPGSVRPSEREMHRIEGLEPDA